MATVAKHVQIARTNGPEAGLEFYLSTPASQRHPQYAEITKRRTDKTRLAAYCSIYADQIGALTTEQQADDHNDLIQTIAEAVMAQLSGIEVVEQVEEAPAIVRGKTKKGGKLPKVAINVITREDAWLMGGADPQFKPRSNGDSPANNGQLYRLNVMGKLALIA
jgi:hypothetical protein